MSEKISIITISYNSKKTIEKTIESILSQSYRPLEYIFVDGASTDGTADIIESYIPKLKEMGIEVQFISEPDKGISDAFNKGIRMATGSIIGITNTDDAILPGTLDYVAENFESSNDVLYGNILWDDRNKGISYIRKSSPDLSDLKFRLKALHPAVYIRKLSYEKYGLYNIDYKYCMDKELLARIQRMGGNFKYVDRTLVSVAAGGISDNNVEGVIEEGEKIAIANGVSVQNAKKYFRKSKIKLKILRILKKLPITRKLLWMSRKDNYENVLLKCKKKPYLYDLYRWTAKIDLLTFLKWIRIPKYKIVYLKRKCEINRNRNKVLFIIWRTLYEHYMIKYGVDIGSKTQIGPGFIVRHIGSIAINSNVIIGKDVEILQGVTIGYERRGTRQGNPKIGNSVWIGSNAVLVGNIHIGNNVLIAPGALVNFNVPDNSIVIGNPGKIIQKDNATEGYVINTLNLVREKKI